MKAVPVVSPERWKAAREKLLVKEKEHTRSHVLAAGGAACRGWLLRKEYGFEAPMVR